MDYTPRYLYSELASAVSAVKGMDASHPWFERWHARIRQYEGMLPSGSGFDHGTKLDLDASNANRLVFLTSFHHMNDGGYYDGWTDHTVVITPSFVGTFDIRVSGRNRNEIKDHIRESFNCTLREDIAYEFYLHEMPEVFKEFVVRSQWENEDGTPSQCYQAWYTSDGQRFWNSFANAKEHAARMMHHAWYAPKRG